MIKSIQNFLSKYPAVLLLIFVYFYFPNLFSYQNAWTHPEQFSIKAGLLESGANLNRQDIKNGLSWYIFEFAQRDTRPLSSYFEILDTKFRCWLWHFMLPHPSLSLTWIFSLILAPLFLYLLLRNLALSENVAISMVAFYLFTPAVLSNEVMLHRPGKPMANFAIIFCLYLASEIRTKFLDQNQTVPLSKFLFFGIITAISFYWDETVWLILPAVLFIFPELFRKREFILLWCLLPVITLIGYFKIMPTFSYWAGFGYPHIEQYDKVGMLNQLNVFTDSFRYLIVNTKNLVLDTMGMMPFSPQAPVCIKVGIITGFAAWIVIMIYLIKTTYKWDHLVFFLIGLILFFNYSMAITEKTWGPYYYGGFWSIFFVIYLGRLIEKASIPKGILTICLFLILINMSNCFLNMNMICKKCQYHWAPSVAKEYFQGNMPGFDPNNKSVFTGSEIKFAIYSYWSKRDSLDSRYSLPKELCWLPLELKNPSQVFIKLPGSDFIETN